MNETDVKLEFGKPEMSAMQKRQAADEARKRKRILRARKLERQRRKAGRRHGR